MLQKKRVRCTNGIYNKEVRQLIKERKQLKRQITNSFLKHKKLMKKIKKYELITKYLSSTLTLSKEV